jgi:starch synthase
MYSQAYGTPTIVRATGGLADSVVDHDARPGEGTGFVFADASSDALLQAMQRAMHVYRDRPQWLALQQRGMARDFGWAQSARRYVELYEAYRRWPDG